MRVAALCAGYGGLELALNDIWPDTHLAWVAEIDPAASAVLAARWPDAPNLGDLTALGSGDALEPVDIVTAGFPRSMPAVLARRSTPRSER